MKKIVIVLISCFISIWAFAQFGGGSGSDIDPYQIYTLTHLEELSDSLNLLNTFTEKHFRLMNNIDEPITNLGNNRTFNGIFNGGGNSINLDLENGYLFGIIGGDGCLDSIKIVGNTQNFISMVSSNEGIIRNCISDVNIIHPVTFPPSIKFGICGTNYGLIESCINLSDFTNVVDPNTGAADIGTMAGICFSNYGTIRKCINMGNSQVKFAEISGISFENLGIIELCINVGNLFSDSQEFCTEYYLIAGIVNLSHVNSIVRNCINTGNVGFHNGIPGGGIISDAYNYAYNSLVENCLNTGRIFGQVGEAYTISGGGIVGLGYANINNCLNIGNNGGGAILDTSYNNSLIISSVTNNYYDKQMCLSKGIAGTDISGSAEGKLTTQLTGTSPELQAMLGDGWSYAEGRYPIPLGLENDSMALVAATPIYLHFENEEDYNHVDSVSKNFTVGLENNVTWDETFGRVSFNGENATLLNIGTEMLTVNLGEYSKKVRINILDTETSNIQETINEKGIIIYPNPASNYININRNGICADKMEICDITGKVISSQFISTEHNQIHIGNLKSGLYLLKIYNNNQNVTTLRFVKN